MRERDNEKRLDELISKAINSEKPQFDPEQWKQKYPLEFQRLLSRASQDSAPAAVGRTESWRSFFSSPISRLAAAAVLMIGVVLFVSRPVSDERQSEPAANAARSPAEMVTAMSLAMAYNRGGLEAMERQCDEAMQRLGSRQVRLSVQELLANSDG